MKLHRELFSNFAPVSSFAFGQGGYIEGVRSVLEFSSGKLKLRLVHGTVEIEGKNLKIDKYTEEDFAFSGSAELVRFIPDKSGDKK